MSAAQRLLVSIEEVTQRQGAPKARSSHAVAVVGRKVYVFGGEYKPRVPIDNKMHVFDLDTRTWSVTQAKGEVPKARVGVTMAASGSKIYVFGGRDEVHEELNEFFSFDTDTGEWKRLSSGDEGPAHRSYHSLAIDESGQNIYAFGGCGRNGRLNDLWVFNIKAGKWTELPKSTCTPRGGPGLAVVNEAVWVVFGFDGSELADIHRFCIDEQKWEQVHPSGANPRGRSVFGCASIGNSLFIYGGEVDPSDQGHLGAGAFTDEALVLDTAKLAWLKPELMVKQGNHPGPRGWYAAASFDKSMLVYGGNSETNDRLDDMFVLSLSAA